MQRSTDRHLRARQRQWLLAVVALVLLSIPVWREPGRSRAASGAPPVYLPMVMRDAVTICFVAPVFRILSSSVKVAAGAKDLSGSHAQVVVDTCGKRVYLPLVVVPKRSLFRMQ
jgi:hypothetical protein